MIWHAADGSNYCSWNIGGWNNTLTRTEAANNGSRDAYPGVPFTVETGRWYDLRLEVTGSRMRGYIDGKLVTDTTAEPRAIATPLFATATYSRSDRTVLVKVVNAGGNPVDMAINLQGTAKVEPNGTALILTGEAEAANSLEEPQKISPKQEPITNATAAFHHTFPPHSLTILRLKASAR